MSKFFKTGEYPEVELSSNLLSYIILTVTMFWVIFADIEPPRIKCPSVKERIAEPNKLTVRVSWETPEGRDTADGILTE